MNLARALVIYCRRLLIGLTASYLIASLACGGTWAARSSFLAMAVIAFIVPWAMNYGSSRLWKIGAIEGRIGRCLHFAEILAFNVALTLILAELGLRNFSKTSPLVSNTLNAYRLVPERDYGGGLRGNSLGFPGKEFQRAKASGVFRIVALGDSFAVGPAVAYADNYLTLLEKSLPATEVYNFGVSGTGPREYQLLLIQQALAYQPDLVLVSVFIGNDITESLATPRQMDPRQLALYCVMSRGVHLLRERWRRDRTSPVNLADRFQAGTLSASTFREVEARRLAVCQKSPPPEFEKKWQRSMGYLERIVADCQREKMPVAFVLIPDEFQVNPDVWADALGASGMDPCCVDKSLPQRRLADFFAQRGVACLDLLPQFTQVNDTYAPRNTHWNDRGNHLAAKCIAEWLTGEPHLLSRPAFAPPRPIP